MLEKIRLALRIKSTAYDGEIQDLIDGCKADMILAGVLTEKVADTDVLIIRAITLYARANFGLANEESEKNRVAYESLKNHLCLSVEYTEVVYV